MTHKSRHHKNGFTLVELFLALAMCSLFFIALRPLYRLSAAAQLSAAVRTIATLCHAQHLTASLHQQQTQVNFNLATGSYTAGQYGTYHLAKSLRFSSTTLPRKERFATACWHANGITQPGTLTLESTDGQTASLTLQRAEHAPVLMYLKHQNAG